MLHNNLLNNKKDSVKIDVIFIEFFKFMLFSYPRQFLHPISRKYISYLSNMNHLDDRLSIHILGNEN